MLLLAMLLIKEKKTSYATDINIIKEINYISLYFLYKKKHIENNSSQGWKKVLYGSPPV